MSKIKTPEWVLQGKKKPKEKKKTGETFEIKFCPKCGSNDVIVVLMNEENQCPVEWRCKKCKWKGTDIQEKQMTENEFMKYLDEKGEEVA